MDNTFILKELAKDNSFDLIDIIKQLKNTVEHTKLRKRKKLDDYEQKLYVYRKHR